MQGNHKNTFRTKYDSISLKLIAKQWRVILYMGTPGGQIPKVCPKMTPITGIMQITPKFGPFNSRKYPQKYIQNNA